MKKLINKFKKWRIRQLAKEGQRDALMAKMGAHFAGDDKEKEVRNIALRYWRFVAYKYRKK